MVSANTKVRVWLGEDVWPGHCWLWQGDGWYHRGNDWLVCWGDVFILKSDKLSKPKRKPGLVRACYLPKDLA